MSLNNAVNQLQQCVQGIRQQWQETSGLWNDSVRWQFEREYWQPLEREAQTTLQEMEHLAQVIAQAQLNVH
jgi:hypothetical protein